MGRGLTISVALYQDCDDAFIRRSLDKHYPKGFTPIWATDNMTEVTTHLVTNNSDIDFSEKYQEIVTGTEDSGGVIFQLSFNLSLYDVQAAPFPALKP